jgi:hypothetical protein
MWQRWAQSRCRRGGGGPNYHPKRHERLVDIGPLDQPLARCARLGDLCAASTAATPAIAGLTPAHICNGTGLSPARIYRARPCHWGFTPPTSAPGPGWPPSLTSHPRLRPQKLCARRWRPSQKRTNSGEHSGTTRACAVLGCSGYLLRACQVDQVHAGDRDHAALRPRKRSCSAAASWQREKSE